MPLDISDEDLGSDDATLMRAFNSLDDHGWNTVGEIYPTTMIRARHMIAVIRDELIDIALCSRRPVDTYQLQSVLPPVTSLDQTDIKVETSRLDR
jgi:hypothetical protein